MKWEDIHVADVVIFERGHTTVSGVVIDIFEGRVVIEHAGPFVMDDWSLSHIIPARYFQDEPDVASQEAARRLGLITEG